MIDLTTQPTFESSLDVTQENTLVKGMSKAKFQVEISFNMDRNRETPKIFVISKDFIIFWAHKNFNSEFLVGEVAFLVGNGQVSDEVEIFSPSGKCQHVLPSLPLAILPNPIVVFVEGRILLCADTVYSYTKSDSTCWSFTPGETKWEEFRTNLTPQPFKR